jgi:SAM-dependent methyltransferase
MRYKVAGRIVRSENAAKPQAQKSEFVRQLLCSLPEVGKTLDYGCGKLRYLAEIAGRSAEVFLLDSRPQLYRRQKIAGVHTSVAEVASRSNSLHLFDLSMAVRSSAMFDRVLCVNVLSAVPIPAVRADPSEHVHQQPQNSQRIA